MGWSLFERIGMSWAWSSSDSDTLRYGYKLENVNINAVYKVAPIIEVKPCANATKTNKIPVLIKSKINLKKRLLSNDKQNNCNWNHSRIKLSNKQITVHFREEKRGRVKQAARGGGVNLLKAVRLAKDSNFDKIPVNLTLNGEQIKQGTSADCFARHFSEKNIWIPCT